MSECLSFWSLSLFFPSPSRFGPVLVARRGLLVETRTGGAAVRPVVDCASGRGVSERVRRPRGRPEPGATKLTVAGERDSTAAEGRSFLYFCMHAVAPCP